MAAKQNLCQYLSENMSSLAIFCIILLSQNVLNVKAATTPPPTVGTTQPPATPAATTTQAPTTQTVTPAPTTQTTTTVAPLPPRSVIGDTEIGQCLCDLTGNECDINCCCDPSCSDEDINVFTCNPVSVVIDDKVCYQKEVFLFTNSPAKTETTNNGLFCIYYDNYNSRNFYLDPDFILDIPSFGEYINKYSTASLQQPVTYVEPVYDFNSFYKSGDPMYIIYEDQARGNMVFPTTLASSVCNDQSPMSYLTELNTECTRDVTVLTQTSCENTDGFSAESYFLNFRVVKLPGLFGYIENGTFTAVSTTASPVTVTTAAATTPSNGTTVAPPSPTTALPPTPTAVDPSLVQNLYNNPYTLEINASFLCRQADGSTSDCVAAAPTFTTNTCNNVVLEIHYQVTTNGTGGIANMEAVIVLGNITQANLPLSQSFNVTFNSLRDTDIPVAKSGNPGYIIGKNLRYGMLNTTSSNLEIDMIGNDGLSVVRSSASGECSSSDSRIPIKFGENMRSGCTITLNLTTINGATTCADIQTRIVEALEGTTSASSVELGTNVYVATFGNTAVNMVGDWVKVLVDGRPNPSDANSAGVPTDTCRLKMGAHIQVLYANVGALANPQAKIIGVAVLYDTVKDIIFRCTGAFCQASTQGLTQRFEVSQTVSFVDVSQPAVKYQGEAPIFIAKVSNDFFYPFLYYTSGARPSSQPHMAVTLFSSIALTMVLRMRGIFL